MAPRPAHIKDKLAKIDRKALAGQFARSSRAAKWLVEEGLMSPPEWQELVHQAYYDMDLGIVFGPDTPQRERLLQRGDKE